MKTKYGEIELLKCSKRIVSKYRKYIRNNELDSEELIQKKLTRNIILGIEQWREDNIVKTRYGKLEIIYDLDTMRVIDIHNKVRSRKYCYINFTQKAELNKLLQIEVNE